MENVEWKNISEWVVKAQSGDNEAVGEIYRRCVDYVYKRARYMLRSDQDAEDATQAVFVEVLGSLHKLKEPASFQSWLNKIVLHRCYRFYGSVEYKNPPASIDEEIELLDDESDAMPLPVIEKAETKEALWAIVESLPPEQKDTVIMYYFYRCKVDEIAEIMECSSGTVKSRLNYARKEIRRQIEEKRKKGIIFPVVVPLPIIAWLVEEQLKMINPPAVMGEGLAQVLSSESASGTVTAASPTVGMLTKIGIGVATAVVVIVGVVFFNQAANDATAPPVGGMINPHEQPSESVQPVESVEPVESGVGAAVPVTEADYARIYYEYMQSELKPNGLWGNTFYDADMVDIDSDGIPQLLVLFDNEMVVVYQAVVDGDTVSVEQTYVEMPSYVSGDDIIESSVGYAWYLQEYQGQKYIARYSTYAFVEESNGLEIARHHIYLYDAKETGALPLYSFGYYVSQDDGVTVRGQLDMSGADTVNLSDSETKSLYAELINPVSDWGMVVGNNDAGFSFVDTGGERLREYFGD